MGKVRTKEGVKRTSSKQTKVLGKVRSPSATAFQRIKALHHADFLSLLGRAKARRIREKLLALADANQIAAVIECVDNVNRNNVPIPIDKVKKLRRHSKLVHALLKPRVSLRRKKHLLNQTGGFLNTLIPLIASRLGGVFDNLSE